MAGRRRRVDEIATDECAVIGANIRFLRQRKGWSQAKLGELMGWSTKSTVCAAEGRRNGRQRRFTTDEVERLAAIFSVPTRHLLARCANCEGHPPTGFSCLTCGAPVKNQHPRMRSQDDDAALPGEAMRLSEMQNEWKRRMHEAASGSGQDAGVPAGGPDLIGEHDSTPTGERKGAHE